MSVDGLSPEMEINILTTGRGIGIGASEFEGRVEVCGEVTNVFNISARRHHQCSYR